MSKDIQKLLADVGLLPSESKVYLSTLELGPSTVQHISAKAKISRTAAYEAIELLQKRGLMTSSLLGKKRLYASEDPARIVSYLKAEQQRFSATLSDIERTVDTMRLLAGGTRPTVKVYEGDEALHAYFDHIAQIKPKILEEIANTDEVYAHLDAEALHAARKTYDWSALSFRLLYRGTIRNPRANAEIRVMKEKFGDFHGNISIYNDYISLVTYVGKPVVVILESKALANTMRVLFNAAWEGCKD